MVGCTTGNSSTSLPSSSNTSNPPQPELFEKTLDGKAILYEKTTNINFSREIILSQSPIELLPQNYRQTEDAWVPYDHDENPVRDPIFSNQAWTNEQFIQSLATFTSPTEENFILLLEGWLAYDDVFLSRQESVYLRDLSHEFYNGDYYWFNNYIDTYTTQYARIDQGYVFGVANVDRTFQTLNEISFERLHTVTFDDQFIYSLQDETFPFGYFGAIDEKIITPRAGNNTQHALSLGPARYLLDTISYWNYLIQEAANDNTLSPYSKQFTLEQLSPGNINLNLMLTQPIETLRSEEYWERSITVAIRDFEWTQCIKKDRLWLNEDRVSSEMVVK
jgi:hypothetical protein